MTPRATTACLALTFACSPAQTRADGPAWSHDTGPPPAEDSNEYDDSDDSDDLATQQTPDLGTWQGVRTFRIDTDWDDYDCEDEVQEAGGVPTDPDRLDALASACPTCTHFYEIALSTDMVCGYLPLDPSPWRALIVGDTSTQVLRLHEGRDESMWVEELDPAAHFDGWSVTYAYEVADGWLEAIAVQGRIDFPETEAHP